MNALHARSHTGHAATGTATTTSPHAFSWVAQIKLALVLSAVAAIAVSGLHGKVSEQALIVSVIVVASLVAWSRIEPMPRLVPEPAHVHVRHR
ncbi:MAG: hypothetical protein Q8M22_05520 [Actinomycetota bacterium]|nr:hypothetical protein [Actinomycetota bacterium]